MDLTPKARELLEAAALATGRTAKELASKVLIDSLQPYIIKPVRIEMNASALNKAFPERAPF
jgi:hypothetical protein